MATRSSEGAPGAADAPRQPPGRGPRGRAALRGRSVRTREFVPGETNVPVAGRVIGAPELEALTDASLDGWLTEGRFAREFSEAFAQGGGPLASAAGRLGIPGQPAGRGRHHLAPTRAAAAAGRRGDHPALGFSTTVGPLYQYGLVPVYVDVELDTFNPSLETIAAAISERTRAILVAHCLGNPFDVEGVAELCREHDLVLIEDCCDALGSTSAGSRWARFGQAATFSFYPAHHMTMGEGGAVVADDPIWLRALGSLREWGRDCWCPPGRERRLRPAIRRAASASCPPDSTTSTSSRTWGSTSRSRTCRRRSASPSSSASRASARAAAHNFARLQARSARSRTGSCSRARSRGRSLLVRLPVHTPRRQLGRAPRPPALPARAQDRQPPDARRQPHSAAGFPRPGAPHRRRRSTTPIA